VLPPKMGEGVSGSSVGSVHLGASFAAGFAVSVSARTRTTRLLRLGTAGRAATLLRQPDARLATWARDAAVREAMALLQGGGGSCGEWDG
jgi:hypothetical protein